MPPPTTAWATTPSAPTWNTPSPSSRAGRCPIFAATEGLITKLMGKGEAAWRCELMELHGDVVEVDV